MSNDYIDMDQVRQVMREEARKIASDSDRADWLAIYCSVIGQSKTMYGNIDNVVDSTDDLFLAYKKRWEET